MKLSWRELSVDMNIGQADAFTGGAEEGRHITRDGEEERNFIGGGEEGTNITRDGERNLGKSTKHERSSTRFEMEERSGETYEEENSINFNSYEEDDMNSTINTKEERKLRRKRIVSSHRLIFPALTRTLWTIIACFSISGNIIPGE